MNLLLDTHIFIWMANEPTRLGKNLAAILGNPNHQLFLSIASVWEIQIKANTGKFQLPISVKDFVTTYRTLNDIHSLPILEEDIWALATLPLHHRDPFDRLLIAQALNRNYTVVTADPFFTNYQVQLMMAS
ncbi:MAG: type II toxin-antitoxin system VapC family toxin [Caldilineaceae bacterium]